ncbi:hypothetical protein ACHRVZ_10515 [Flavobacterium sp. FlaQc-57]|uniref:hypothetical protein n=1 Tax=Flavobacterium sp. FlaQc-57 TaxID=3374186 RepID=UPI0037566329
MNNWIIGGLVFTIIGYIFTGIGYFKQIKDAERDKIELNDFRAQSLSNDGKIIGHVELNSNKIDTVTKEVIESRDVFDKKINVSNDYDLKKLKSDSPYVEVLSNAIAFSPENEGIKYRIVFINTKLRDAINVSFEFFILFRNINDTDWGDYYQYNNLGNKIPRISKEHPISTSGTINLSYTNFVKLAKGGLIQIRVKFYDEILDEYISYKLNYKMKGDNAIEIFIGDKESENRIESFMKKISYKNKL